MESLHVNMDSKVQDYLGHLADQVFSNHLLVKKIWKHFSLDTLKSLSLVSRKFCTLSREFLRAYQFTTLAVSGRGSPCKRLKVADELIGKSTDNPFNAISLCKPQECFLIYPKFSCSDTCREGNVEELYPNLVKFDNWKMIEIFSPHGVHRCPSLQLFSMLIFRNCRSVKVLCFSGNSSPVRKALEDYIKIHGTEQPVFPELEILYITLGTTDIAKTIFICAPKLTTIRGPIIMRHIMGYNRSPPIFPKEKWGLITDTHVYRSQEIVMLATAGMRIEKLVLTCGLTYWPESIEHFQTSLTLPQQMFTKSVRILSSWSDSVAFIATRNTEPWVNLQSLTLRSFDTCPDPPLIPINQSSLPAIDFDKMFPRLQKMSIKFLTRYNFGFIPAIFNTVRYKMGDYKSSSVTHLRLIHKLSEECLVEIVRIFPNVELLEVMDLDYVPLATRQDLKKHFRFWGSKCYFKRLKKLRLVGTLSAVRIDDYMGYSAEMMKFGDVEFWRKFSLAPKGFSIFNKDGLKSIEIQQQRPHYQEVHDAKEATNILSTHAAKLILAKMPGFIIKLRILCQCAQCQQIGDTHFEHLKHFAKITCSLHLHDYPEITIVFEENMCDF